MKNRLSDIILFNNDSQKEKLIQRNTVYFVGSGPGDP